MNRSANAVVRSAATDIPRQSVINLAVAGVRIGRKEHRRSHDLPGLAIAALRHLLHQPRLLDRMTAVFGKPFNRRDTLSGRTRNQDLTRADRIPLQNYSASAALADSTSVFRASKIEVVAKSPQQRRRGIDL